MILDEIIENYPDDEFLIADGFNDAIIGIATDFIGAPLDSEDCRYTARLIYSVSKCIAILMSNDEMNDSEALEYFTFNVSGAYVGPDTPIWCWDDF